MSKEIRLRGKSYRRNQWPLVCVPLVAKSSDAVLEEAALLVGKKPDVIEWRIDFLEGLEDTSEVVQLLGKLRVVIGDIPLLLTRRSVNEGGELIALDEAAVLDLYLHLLSTFQIDAIDYEIALPEANWSTLAEACKRSNVLLIGSYHDFDETPEQHIILNKLLLAERLGADIAKVAVMPESRADVLRLMTVTETADNQLSIPVITMSMAELGLSTRLMGSVFGSCLTFAVGGKVSAPGQLPIEDVRAVTSVIQKHQ